MQYFVAQDVLNLSVVVTENVNLTLTSIVDPVDRWEAEVELHSSTHLRDLP